MNSAQYRGDSGFAGRTYHIVGNLMSRLKCFVLDICRPKEKQGGSVVVLYMKDRRFETHRRHRVVSFSKTLYPMLSTDSTHEDRKSSLNDWKIVDWEVEH